MALATTAASTPLVVLSRELGSGHMCSCLGVLWSPAGLEHQTADVVALCVANGDEWYNTPEDKIVGTVYELLRSIHARMAEVGLTSVASCDLDVVEIGTVDSWLLIPFFLVRD